MVECMPIGRREKGMSNFYNLKKKVDRAAEVPEEVAKEFLQKFLYKSLQKDRAVF